MDSQPGMSSGDSVTTGATDKSSSPREKSQAPRSLPPPPLPALPREEDRGPSPLPRWQRLRIKASALLNWPRRHGPHNVLVLPLNKVAKLNVSLTEIAAMNFVRDNTSIPVPKSKVSKTSITAFKLYMHYFRFSLFCFHF